jgi:hypothetical protein
VPNVNRWVLVSLVCALTNVAGAQDTAAPPPPAPAKESEKDKAPTVSLRGQPIYHCRAPAEYLRRGVGIKNVHAVGDVNDPNPRHEYVTHLIIDFTDIADRHWAVQCLGNGRLDEKTLPIEKFFGDEPSSTDRRRFAKRFIYMFDGPVKTKDKDEPTALNGRDLEFVQALPDALKARLLNALGDLAGRRE